MASALAAACLCGAVTDAAAIGSCPALGQSSSCSVLITIQPTGQLTFEVDPAVPPFDGDDDVLVGVLNRSGATVFGIRLDGAGIFGFDGDGANGGDYAGPGTSFAVESANGGVVNFDRGLDDNQFLWFSLEGSPSKSMLAGSVTIDPGHGLSCSGNEQPGAVGATNFPASDPPAGRLHEDQLAADIARSLQARLGSAGYRVTMTKSDANSCLTLLERGNRANKARSNVFVSIHLNAPSRLPFGITNGSSALYNSAKSSSKVLADAIVAPVAAAVGVANRGSAARDDLGVLKATATRMAAVLVEVARLSGNDEVVMHQTGSTDKAAAGIMAGIDAFIQR